MWNDLSPRINSVKALRTPMTLLKDCYSNETRNIRIYYTTMSINPRPYLLGESESLTHKIHFALEK